MQKCKAFLAGFAFFGFIIFCGAALFDISTEAETAAELGLKIRRN